MKPRIFAGAGEPSGDRILALTLQGLRAHYPGMEIAGFGGPLSEAQGLQSVFPIGTLAISGVGDVARRGLSLALSYLRLKKTLRSFKPDLVLLVDYPGMNTGLARLALKLGCPVHCIAPPQLWAYRHPGARLEHLRRALRGASLQVLFPFEREFYAPWARKFCQGHFFGEPALQPPSGSRLLLCPGSRREVAHRNLGAWLNHLPDWPGGIDVLTPEFLEADVHGWIQGRANVSIVTDSEQAFARAASAISFPGTLTLELFLRRIPTRVWAVLDPLTLWAGKRKLRSRFVALPNLLLDREVYPEWIGTAGDFKRSPPAVPDQNPPPVSERDLTAVLEKMGASDGAACAVQSCLELLL